LQALFISSLGILAVLVLQSRLVAQPANVFASIPSASCNAKRMRRAVAVDTEEQQYMASVGAGY